VRSTAIAVGPGDAGPTIDPESPGVVPGSVVRETVRSDEPMTAELTEGGYWVVTGRIARRRPAPPTGVAQ
jgi:hypothetical protein